MADHTLDMLRSAIRAMNEVVLPAVDRGHPLALEQATLVAKILQLLEQRLPHWPARLRVELHDHVALARTLAADAPAVSPAVAEALADAAARGEAALADGDATPAQWQRAARDLGGLVDALVRAAQDGDATRRRRIEAAVLAAADPVLSLHRAWFLPQGWEPDSAAVPTLEQALQRGAGARS